ncbi:MAG: guanylate kinase [Chloroflexota bacterium]|nr:guanylate kinase [Chloroflexota bacterium]
MTLLVLSAEGKLRGNQLRDIPEINPPTPLLIIISGPSGVGKDATLSELIKMDRPWYFPVTATTRQPRPEEVDGRDYHFLSESIFRQMCQRSEFLEFAEVYGNLYGVPRNEIRKGLNKGLDVILKIDVQGSATVKNIVPEAVSIFITPESGDDLHERLSQRNTESKADLSIRLETAQSELGEIGKFDYRVINRNGMLAQTVSCIDAIITAEKSRVHPRMVNIL